MTRLFRCFYLAVLFAFSMTAIAGCSHVPSPPVVLNPPPCDQEVCWTYSKDYESKTVTIDVNEEAYPGYTIICK